MAKTKYDTQGKERVKCEECDGFFHRADLHVEKVHGMTSAEYLEKHPGSDLVSPHAARKAGASEEVESARPKRAKKKKTLKTQAREAGAASARPFEFKSGITLHPRADLSEGDEMYVPEFDKDWEMSTKELERWEAYAATVSEREHFLDVGPTGCGKTDSQRQFAAVMNQPIRYVGLGGDVRVSKFFGTKTVVLDEATGQTLVKWEDGVFTEAWRRGHWIQLDELDGAPPEILMHLHGPLQATPLLVVESKEGGEEVPQHPNFRVFASANTLGRGDDTGLYAGTNVLNEAFLDRFGVVMNSGYPDKKSEVNILAAKCGVDKTTAARMVTVAQDVRRALAKEECFCTFSTRRLLKWASKARLFGDVQLASELTVTNKLTSVDRVFVKSIIQRHFGGAV